MAAVSLVVVDSEVPDDEVRRWRNSKDTPVLDDLVAAAPRLLLGTTLDDDFDFVPGSAYRVFALLFLRGTTPEYVVPLGPVMRLGIDMPSAEEPVGEVADALDAVVVVLLGFGPGEVRVRGPVPDEPGRVVEPFGHPAVEPVQVLEVLAGPAHRFLEAAEGRLVPFEPLTAQAEQEGALVSLELAAQEVQLLVHVLIIEDACRKRQAVSEAGAFEGEERPGSERLPVTTLSNFQSGALFAMQHNGRDRALKVTADGKGLVGHAGAVLLRKAADQCGLSGLLSGALRQKRRPRLLDRGTVLVSVAVAIALGATSMSDKEGLPRRGRSRCVPGHPGRPAHHPPRRQTDMKSKNRLRHDP